MNRPKVYTLLQTLLDSTPLPRDILEYIIIPDLLPSTDLTRQKMKSVMRSLERLNGCVCAYCSEKHVSVTKIKRNNQPFAQETIPYCKDCASQHQRNYATWNRRSRKNLTNHFFNAYRQGHWNTHIRKHLTIQEILDQIPGNIAMAIELGFGNLVPQIMAPIAGLFGGLVL